MVRPVVQWLGRMGGFGCVVVVGVLQFDGYGL